MQNFERWGLRLRASCGWGLRPQTPIGLWRLGGSDPDPQTQPPLCKFLATRLLAVISVSELSPEPVAYAGF